LVTREGLLAAIALMLLPFVIFFVLVKILPPWWEGEADESLRRLHAAAGVGRARD
jgi:hypothetical protein